MFAVDFRAPKRRIVLITLVIMVVLLIGAVFRFDIRPETTESETSGTDSFSVADYIASFGIETDESTCVIDEVIVPTEFNDVYENYNAIQKEQGFDLSSYKGKTLSRYTLEVTNYTEKEKEVFAEVLTYRGKVVAADIYCTNAEGFILPLK